MQYTGGREEGGLQLISHLDQPLSRLDTVYCIVQYSVEYSAQYSVQYSLQCTIQCSIGVWGVQALMGLQLFSH